MKAEEFTWGLGLEHEMHLFHIPNVNRKEAIKELILFDSESAVYRLLKNKHKLSKKDIEFLEGIPFELSGRVCNKKVVLERVPFKMPELISWKPFCSLLDKRKTLAIQELQLQKINFIKILKKDELTRKLIRKYGEIDEHPFGMTRYLRIGKVVNDSYELLEKVYTDYTGSYHITITMPHKKDISDKEFIRMHQNFANQLQWLEPILLLGFFTGDEYAPGSNKDRVRGSFRVMNVGWGNFAGSDVRLFDKGLGRYAKTPTYWRDNFSLEGSDKLKACYKPSASALKENGISSLSTDFRTFGDNQKGERVSGYPMHRPNGMEFRIFDNFNDSYLDHLLLFVFLVMQNSYDHETEKYVYKNKVWINELHNIMRYGCAAKISNSYRKLLEKELMIKIKKKDGVNLYNCVLESLFQKNKNKFYFKILYKDNLILKKDLHLYYAHTNERAWEFAFLLKLNRNNLYMNKMNQFIYIVSYLTKINVKKARELLLIVFGSSWKIDVDNILLFLKNRKLIKVKNLQFEKNNISINQRFIHEFNFETNNFYLQNFFRDRGGFSNNFLQNIYIKSWKIDLN